MCRLATLLVYLLHIVFLSIFYIYFAIQKKKNRRFSIYRCLSTLKWVIFILLLLLLSVRFYTILFCCMLILFYYIFLLKSRTSIKDDMNMCLYVKKILTSQTGFIRLGIFFLVLGLEFLLDTILSKSSKK